MEIAFAVVSLTAIGAFCAVLLAVASKIMAVKVDERSEEILNAFPNSNCGACGFPGCAGYAAALLSGDEKNISLCTPGGQETIQKLSLILGVEAVESIRKFAAVHCGAVDNDKERKMNYSGIKSCLAAYEFFGGDFSCSYGCLGYGDCVRLCPNGAICAENGLAVIDTELCNGCTLCMKACPVKLIKIYDEEVKVQVACNNRERGAVVRNKCTKCCLGCGKCMRECPEAAITVENNLAKIDYSKCTFCNHCVTICVNKCIKNI